MGEGSQAVRSGLETAGSGSAPRPLTAVLCFVAAGLAVGGLFEPWFRRTVTCDGVAAVSNGSVRVFDANFFPTYLDGVALSCGAAVLLYAGLRALNVVRSPNLWKLMALGAALVLAGSVVSGDNYPLVPACSTAFSRGPGKYFGWAALVVMLGAFASYARSRAAGLPD